MTTRSTFLLAIILATLLTPSNGFSNFFRPSKRRTDTSPTKPVTRATPPPPPASQVAENSMPTIPSLPENLNPLTPSAWNSVTSGVLGFASKFAPKGIKGDTSHAARVQINRLPPQSFQIDLTDVPIVGPALSGTYAKVDKKSITKPSVVIASPEKKVEALQSAVDKGSLEFDIQGLLSSSLDVKLEPNMPGEAPVTVESPLIPKWPFARKKSDWYKVSNIGNGETYYFNHKTGKTQSQEPEGM